MTGAHDQKLPERLDIAVVGAGPCGLAVGVAAKEAGLPAALFDRGCLVQAIVGYPPYMTFFSTPERLEIGSIPFVVADDKPTRREALSYYRAVAVRHSLDVRQYEEVVSVVPSDGGFELETSRLTGARGRFFASSVVIATGALGHPNRLEVPGGDATHVLHTFQEAHPYFDQDVTVVGGGNSAVEAALALFRGGARVTVVHFEDSFDRGVKPWILPDIVNRIRHGEIAVRWRTRVDEIRPDAIVLRGAGAEPGGDGPPGNAPSDPPGEEPSGAPSETPCNAPSDPPSNELSDTPDDLSCEQRLEELPADWVFAMTGWRPDHDFLHVAGVQTDPETGVPVHDPETLETNVPGVFVAGVLTAGFDANKIFIENGRHHGSAIVTAIRRGRDQPASA